MVGRTCFTTFESNDCSKRTFFRCSLVSSGRKTVTTTEQMLDEMCATLGGRAAEQVIFNNISTGALSDLETVTKRAQAMVTIYGLSPNIGNISYYDSSGQSEYSFGKPYSEETAKKIDAEIKGIIENQYDRAVKNSY
jgi:cell division protease FtsH